MRRLPRDQQIKVLKRINRLLDAERSGEDHTKELQALGELLGHDDKPTYRPGHISQDEYRKYMPVAKANDIPLRVYKDRLRRGKSAKDAATKPYFKKSEVPEQDFLDLALRNGITKPVYWWRRRKGWTKEDAATKPIAARKGQKEKE